VVGDAGTIRIGSNQTAAYISGTVNATNATFTNVTVNTLLTYLGTNLTARMLGNIYSNDLHLNGTPAISISVGANASLCGSGSPPAGYYEWPGYCDLGGILVITNGSTSSSTNTLSYGLFTNTFAHAFNNPPCVTWTTVTNGTDGGYSNLGASGASPMASVYGLYADVTTTNFVIRSRGDTAWTAGLYLGFQFIVQPVQGW
jgi:hypothetical protein